MSIIYKIQVHRTCKVSRGGMFQNLKTIARNLKKVGPKIRRGSWTILGLIENNTGECNRIWLYMYCGRSKALFSQGFHKRYDSKLVLDIEI